LPLLVLSPTSAVIQTYCQFERSREQCSISTALDVTNEKIKYYFTLFRRCWCYHQQFFFIFLLVGDNTNKGSKKDLRYNPSRKFNLNTTFSPLLVLSPTSAVIQTYCQFERSREQCSISTALDVTHLDFVGCMTSRLRSM
jgi:hypothetical protein